MRRFYLAAFLLGLLSGFSQCQTPESAALAISGYLMLSPPSNLFAPGAVVMMQADDQGLAQLRLLCGPRASLGENFAPRVSETVSSTLKMSRHQRINLEADAVDRFRTRTHMDEVESVSVTFSSPKLLELSEDEVIEGVHNRTDACQKAIDMRLANGFAPTVVTSAYMADVEYNVLFKHDAQLSKSVKVKKMTQIAGKLGGGHTNITEKSVRAINLILAVKSDDWLVHIRADGDVPPVHVPSSSLEPGYAEALPGAEAPLIAPAAGWVNPIIGD